MRFSTGRGPRVLLLLPHFRRDLFFFISIFQQPPGKLVANSRPHCALPATNPRVSDSVR